MFIFHRRVSLQDTDATGVLYFAQQFNMAMQTFEEFLKERGFPIRQLFDSRYLMPIVHAESDYLAPVMIDDELTIQMRVSRLGVSSITLDFELCDVTRNITVGKVKIVHVTVDREKRTPVPIPDFLKGILGVPSESKV